VGDGVWRRRHRRSEHALFSRRGGARRRTGCLERLSPARSPEPTSLSVFRALGTVMRGGSTTLTIDASASGGFNSAINLSCSGQPTGVTCAFAPASIMPGGSSSTLTISVGSAYVPPMGYMAWAPFTGIGFARSGVWDSSQTPERHNAADWDMGTGIRCGVARVAAAMGRWMRRLLEQPYESARSATMMVVGASGGTTHSMPVSLTIPVRECCTLG